MMSLRAMLVLQLAMIFLYAMQLDAVSIVKILYTADDLSSEESTKKHLEVGKLELHLEGKALIDYQESKVDGGKRCARFVVDNVRLSDESDKTIKKLSKNIGVGYTLTLTLNGKHGHSKLIAEFTYDPEQVNVEYAIGDVINGNGSLLITVQNKHVLRALDTNHESILRLARKNYQHGFYLCC